MPVSSRSKPKPSLASKWTTVVQGRLPSWLTHTVYLLSTKYTALTGRHPRLFAALHPFLVIFVLFRVGLFVALWWPRHKAHPEGRSMFVTAVFALPVWAGWMLGMHAWAVWGRARGRNRRGGRGYVPLPVASELDDVELELGVADGHYDHDHADVEAEHVNRRPNNLPNSNSERHVLTIPALLSYLAIIILAIYLFRTREAPGDRRYKAVVDRANVESELRREGHADGQKIFIAAMFYDNEAVLPRWTTELLKLINYLGPDNVFVSIVESHSKDSTPALLRILDAHLVAARVPHRILIQLDDSLLPAGVKRPNPMQNKPPRIEFLAALRNIVLEPLYRARLGWDRDIDGDSEGDGEEKGEGEVAEGRWDKVLFSNDVFVEAESMAELLWTKEGQYDMACGMDFQQWGLYDLWVVRDRLGKSVSGLYPYFLEPQGFLAVMQDEPAEVYTCWNGIVVMDADPFLHPSMRRAGNSSSSSSSSSNTQLAFRGSNIAHGECFSSECFNLPYDLRRYFSTNSTSTSREITLPNPADPTRIYMNPRVIVAYKWSFYVYYKHVLRHWLVRWWMDRVEVGLGVGAGKVENRDLEATMKRREHAMQSARVILGDPRPTRIYEGYECHQPPI